MTQGRRNSPHSWRTLLAIAIGGLLLRLFAAVLISPSPPVSGEAIYSFRAQAWNQRAPTAVDLERPPGVMYFYRLLTLVFGEDRIVLRFGNAFLGALLLPVLYGWSRKYVDHRAALTATLFAAIHPELISYSASLWSEPLYLILIYSAFLVFLHPHRPFSIQRSVLLGLLLAMACLTRDIALFFLPFVLLEFLRGFRSDLPRSVAAVTAFLVAFALPILPRSMEMTERSGSLVLISSLNAERLFVGNVPSKKDPLNVQLGKGIEMYLALSPDPQERTRLALKEVSAAIRQQMPYWPFEKLWDELYHLFTPNSYSAMRMFANPKDQNWAGKRAYQFSIPALDHQEIRISLGMLTIFASVATLLCGAIGLSLLRFSSNAFPLVVFALVHIAPTIVTSASSRYRLPLLPILMLGGAALLIHGRALWRDASPRRRWVAIAMLLLATTFLARGIGQIYPPTFA